MPLYMCSKCGSVDNTACGGYWRQEMEANYSKDFKPLCSSCYPEMGKWHGDFSFGFGFLAGQENQMIEFLLTLALVIGLPLIVLHILFSAFCETEWKD